MIPKLRKLHVKTKVVMAKFGKGINNGLPIFDVPMDFSVEEKNLDSREFPVLNVRTPRGVTTAGETGTSYHLGARESEKLTAVFGTKWYYYDTVAGDWVTIAGTLTAAASGESIDFMDKTILVNGTDMVYWDGATVTPAFATVATMPASSFLTVHANRIYACHKDASELHFSSLRIYNDWTTADDSGTIAVDTENGENSSGIVSYANHIIYFKPHSIHELYGTGPHNFSLQTISTSIGCVAHRTISNIRGILLFLGEEGVYVYVGGTVPELVSTPFIDGYIERMDKTNIDKACSGVDGPRYYLCLPIDNNARVLLTYDVENKCWHVEDDTNIVQFARFKDQLYGLTSAGNSYLMQDKWLGATESVPWFFLTKKIALDGMSSDTSVHSIHVGVDLPTGSTMACEVKTNEETTFTSVFTFTPATTLQNQTINIPLTVAKSAKWFQLKFSGVGECTMHRAEIVMRVKRKEYLNG